MYKKKADFFDRQASNIWANDEYSKEELFKIDRIFKLSNIKAGAKVIEPGCGTGRLTKLIAKQCGMSGKVIAFDISSRMIDKAKERLRDYENTELLCASLEEIKFVKETYDVAVCHQVFPHFEDQKKALKILGDALKKDGYLIISHLVGIEEINDVHRKSNSPVENDIMPSNEDIEKMLNEEGFAMLLLEDKEEVFNILAQKK